MKLTGAETVGIDGDDFAKAAEALSAAGWTELATKYVQHVLRVSANVVRGNVRARARHHHRTGRLEANVHTTWKGAGLAFQLRVAATGPVAHLIVRGVRPHLIESIRPMPTSVPLHPFAHVVENRGFRGDPFVHKGIRDSLPAIQELVDQAAKDMAAELARRIEGKAA